VAQTQPDGPAAKAGIASGDVIVAVDSSPISSSADLVARIGAMAPGSEVKIRFLHDGADRTVSVTLGELPATPFKAATLPAQKQPEGLGISVAPAASVEGAGSKGAVITDVDPNGVAAERGLAAGDIILEVSGTPVSTSADVHRELSKAQESGKRDILMRIKSQNNDVRFVALPIAAAKPTLWGRIENWIHSM
jgi:serine protease Do